MDEFTRKLIENLQRAAGVSTVDQLKKLIADQSELARVAEAVKAAQGMKADLDYVAQIKKLVEDNSFAAEAQKILAEEKQRRLDLVNMSHAFAKPVINHTALIPPVPEAPGKVTHDRLMNYIKEFEDELDADHEIGARLVSFGQTVTFHVEDVGYWGDMICFYGRDEDGQLLQLVQHYTQLSVLLIAVKKQGEKPRRIGFIQDGDK